MLYVFDATSLWLRGRIGWRSLLLALRTRQPAVAGRHGSEIICRDLARDFFDPGDSEADNDPMIRDALRRAAIAVGDIPWQHNRDQAQAAVVVFLRAVAASPERACPGLTALAEAAARSVDQPDRWPEFEVANP